jgi:tyrosyl-tRNA synthetase
MSKVITDEKLIQDILERGVDQFIDPNGVFLEKLKKTPSDIIIKFGVDPTRPDLHLGHAVILRKLKKFQDLGCKVVFLIGTLTAQIGDPTGKNELRPEIDNSEIEKNMKTYLEQCGLILSTKISVFSWIVNSDWFVTVHDVLGIKNNYLKREVDFRKIESNFPLDEKDIFNRADNWSKTRMQKEKIHTRTFLNILAILRKISFSRLIERDMFQERIKKGLSIHMNEMIYPIIQGIDSDAIFQYYGACDLEIGGTDQYFNMFIGRDVMEISGHPPQSVLSLKILEGLDGKEKMSKSLNNCINLTDEFNDMFGKVMSIRDDLIKKYFELCTELPLEEIKKVDLNNPKEAKLRLASEIVALYHGEKKALEAKENWEKTFSKKEIPENIEEVFSKKGEMLSDFLVSQKILNSKGEWRRLVEGNAIHDLSLGENIRDFNFKIEKDLTLKIGKKRFIKIKIK